MSDYDTAATIEDGKNESLQAGANLSHLPTHIQNELKRRAPQAKQKKTKFDVIAFLERVKAMGPDTLHKPFLQEQLDDLRNNDQPDGYYSSTMVLAMIAGAKALPYASRQALELAEANGFDLNPVEPRVLEAA